MAVHKYWPGIIPAIMLIFIPLSYFRHLLNISFYFTCLYLAIFALIIIATVSKQNKDIKIFSNLRYFYLYVILQIPILLIISFFSNDVYFSSTRSLFSMFDLFSMFSIFYFIQYFYTKNSRWRHFFELCSLFLLIFLILGQLFIDEWTWGGGAGLRFSGGLNPNSISFFTALFLCQSHINALLDGKWSYLQRIIWLLSAIIIIWSFSRTTILSIIILYVFYLSYLLIKKLYSLLKQEKLNLNKVFISVLKLSTCGILITFILKKVYESELYFLIQERLFNIDNITSRTSAWDYALNSFNSNPLIGGLGWWGSENVITSMDIGANSAHSLYVRLLSEVGIIGLITIVILPLAILIILLINSNKISTYFKSPISIYLVGTLISLFFLTQFFEERYLSGIFDYTTNVTIWFMSFSLVVVHSLKNFKIEI